MQGKTPVLLLIVLYGGAFLAGFNENLVNMALVSMMNEFGIDSVMAQWTVTGYMIVATVVVTCMAFLYRRFKLRTLFFSAAILSFAGSLLGLLSTSFTTLMIARLVQAVGTGIFIPLMMNTVLIVVPKNKLGTFLSIGGCMITFGPAFAPVVCGAIVTGFGWHNVFVVPMIAMAVLALLGLVAVKNLGSDQDAHLDAPSVALSMVVLTALSFGLAELTIQVPLAIGSLVVAVVVAVVFVIRQLRCTYPLIDLTPMRSRLFWPSILLTTVAMMGSFSTNVLLPMYFESGLGMTASLAGIIILVPVLGNAVTTLVGGRMMDKKGEWPLLPLGFSIIAVGFIIMAVLAPSLSLAAIFIAALLVYAGTGLIFSPSQTAGLRTLPPEQNPFGVALSTTFVQMAACIGPSLYTGILSTGQGSALAAGADFGHATASGFSMAMIVAAVIAAAGAALAFVYARAAVKRAAAQRAEAASEPIETSALAHIMQADPYTLPDTALVRDAMQLFVDRRVGGVPLIDAAGRPTGFVSDGDVMRYLADTHPVVKSVYSLVELANSQAFDDRLRELIDLPVSTIATDKLVSLDAGASLKDACSLLAMRKLKKVPVVRDGHIVGTVNRSDVLRYAMESALEEA